MADPPFRGRGRGRGRGGGGDRSLPFHPAAGGDGSRGNQGSRGGRGGDRGFGRDRGRGAAAEVEVFSQGTGFPPVVEPAVKKLEDELASKTKSVTAKSSTVMPAPFPMRPGFGGQGKPVTLWANYFNLLSQKDIRFHRYSIEFLGQKNDKPPPKKLAKRVVQLLIEDHLAPAGYDVITDFRSTLISKTQLEPDREEYTVLYRGEEEDDPAASGRTVQVRLQLTGDLTFWQLLSHVTSSQIDSQLGNKEDIIQTLNILLGHDAKIAKTIASVGANRHFSLAPSAGDQMSLGAGLYAVRGFFISARAATGRILVNVQVKNFAVYQDGPLEQLAQLFTSHNGPNKASLGNFLKRVSIDVIHINRTNKHGGRIPRFKTIFGLATPGDGRQLAKPPIVPTFGSGPKDVKFFVGSSNKDIAPEPPAQSTSSKKKKNKPIGPATPTPTQGQYISVFDFFQQQYGITVKDTNLPVINVGTRDNPSYLPLQVCNVRPGQPANSKLSPAQTQRMIGFAVRKPTENAHSIITAGAQLLGFAPNSAKLNGFGVTVNPKLIAVPGRVLNPPQLRYAATSTVTPRFGSWNLQTHSSIGPRSLKMSQHAALPSWTWLLVYLKGSEVWKISQSFLAVMDDLTANLKAVGLQVTPFVPGQRVEVFRGDPGTKIDEAVQRFASSPQRPKLIFAVIPEQDSTSVYNRIKYLCDVKHGFINICVLDSKFSRANAQYHANVALKFNLKLGGRNHIVDSDKLGVIGEKKTMVVGIDVTHPSPGSTSSAPSVAGIVASVDECLSQWPADLRLQTARQEIVQDLDDMLKSRLQLWKKRQGSLPANLIIYRDGVSEGQYNLVLEKELPAMRKACEALYPDTSTKAGTPKITIIIVGKRHHTRFYATKKEDADRSWNPQNGTVVDRGVTEAANWDFFLQAHTALQGTARPAHYYVIYDEIFRGRKSKLPFMHAADELEDLTHKMCYLFGRATKAVSICPPAYYADLVCERARCYLSSVFNPATETSSEGSVAGQGTASAERLPDPSLVRIHENVRNVMFYT